MYGTRVIVPVFLTIAYISNPTRNCHNNSQLGWDLVYNKKIKVMRIFERADKGQTSCHTPLKYMTPAPTDSMVLGTSRMETLK